MICPKCGRDLEDGSRLCPWCGERLPTPPVRSSSNGRKAAVVTVAVIAVALVAALLVVVSNGNGDGSAMSPMDNGNDGTPDATEVEELIKVAEGVYASGDDTSLFTFTWDTDEEQNRVLTIRLSEDASEPGDRYDWYLYDNSTWPWHIQHLDKEDPVLYWTVGDDVLGEYVLGVYCYDDDGSFLTHMTGTDYKVKVYIDGEITKTYDWTYQGTEIETSLTYSYFDFLESSGANGADMEVRSGYGDTDYSVVTMFAAVDDTVRGLESTLSGEYLDLYGEMSEQGYAEFLLAFVQECFGYTYDSLLYGQSEYFAFPVETIHYGVGDCEDTAILLAALYEAAGYDAGIVILPGHAITAVALGEYAAGPVGPGYEREVSEFSMTVDGVTYYGCETTLSSNGYGIGWISSDYRVDQDGDIVYKGTTYADSGYGLYRVRGE